MNTILLERETCLASLDSALADALQGSGRMVLISGEAGIGKTTLVTHYSAQKRQHVRTLRGTSDPLYISHPFCPLYDIARQLPGSKLGTMVWEAQQMEILYYFLDILEAEPTIVIFEDIHWADQATLDLLRFICRRISQIKCLLLATYRDDELTLDHPLRTVLGHLTGPHVRRLHLEPLSERAVSQLAASCGRKANGLYAATGGNPFFITELLASESTELPHSISEAVLARMAHLSSRARNIVEVAALIPKERFTLSRLHEIWDVSDEALDEAISSGIIHIEDDMIVFRHDLARHVVIDAMTSVRQKLLNTVILQALVRLVDEGKQVALSQVVHHARLIGDWKSILRFAPLAAQESIKFGAHREAVAYYHMLLEYTDHLGAAEQAELLEKLAYEYYVTGQITEAIECRQQALSIWQQQAEHLREGDTLRWLSRLHWFMGNRQMAEHYAQEAIEVLDTLPPGRELAMAYSNLSQLHMLANQAEAAVEQGQKAIALAEQLGDHEILSHALNNVGTAAWQIAPDHQEAQQMLERSLALALENGFEEHAARAYTNLASKSVTSKSYELAGQYLQDGIDYSSKHDLDSWGYYMRGWNARSLVEQGRWIEAANEAQDVLANYEGRALAIRLPTLLALAQLYVRQGDDRAAQLLEELADMVETVEESQRLIPLLIAQAEWAWWQQDHNALIKAAMRGFEMALETRDQWDAGALGILLWRAGALTELPDFVAEPYRLQISGDWEPAADAWATIGCPYEQAMTLADGDEAAQQTALLIFDRLGAEPASKWLRNRMRQEGAVVPRGPRPETQENPAGLTQRQMEVLRLLVNGLSDVEISEQLFISPKTAGHHVSSILNKLDVRNRQEAAVLAVQNGWFRPA